VLSGPGKATLNAQVSMLSDKEPRIDTKSEAQIVARLWINEADRAVSIDTRVPVR